MDSVTITHAVFSNVYYKSKKVSPLFTKTKKSKVKIDRRSNMVNPMVRSKEKKPWKKIRSFPSYMHIYIMRFSKARLPRPPR